MKRVAFCFLLIMCLLLGACGESNPPAAQATPTSAASSTTSAITTSGATTTANSTTQTLRTLTPIPPRPAQNQTLAQIDTGLPLYPSAATISVGTTFETTIGQPFVKALGGNTSKIKYQVYTTNQAPARVLQYYEEELAGMGLVKVTTRKMPQIPNFSLTVNGIAYASDDSIPDINSVGVAVVGPLSSATISQLATLDPAFGKNVKSGDTLIILASGL